MESLSTNPKPTPPTPEAPEHDAAVRTRLLHAAVHVFDRKGYAGASVREVAEMAGVTKPAVYYHFGSKEGLLVAILEQAKREVETAIDRAVARPGTARDRILALCEDVYGLFGQNVPDRAGGPRRLSRPARWRAAVRRDRLRAAVPRGARADRRPTAWPAGEFGDVPPRDVALAVMGILEGCNERQLHPAFEPVGTGGLRRLINLLFDGAVNAPRTQGEDRP